MRDWDPENSSSFFDISATFSSSEQHKSSRSAFLKSAEILNNRRKNRALRAVLLRSSKKFKSGFKGAALKSAISVCPFRQYGINCEHKCDCLRGASCNRTDGTCRCLPGTTGERYSLLHHCNCYIFFKMQEQNAIFLKTHNAW